MPGYNINSTYHLPALDSADESGGWIVLRNKEYIATTTYVSNNTAKLIVTAAPQLKEPVGVYRPGLCLASVTVCTMQLPGIAFGALQCKIILC